MSCLEKNLEQIAKYNKPLADRIAAHEIVDQHRFRLDYSKCDDLNIYVDGVPIHDEIDPVGQAKDVFTKNYKEGNVSLIFGLGLGYLFNRFVKETKDRILVYEPDMDILRITLGVFDFSEALANPKIKIVHDKFNLKPSIETMKTKDDDMTLYFLPYHSCHHKPVLDELVSELSQIHSLMEIGFKELAKKSTAWAMSTASNLASIAKNEELEALEDKFKDKPAVIVSAGPSLLKSIEAIKKYRDKIVVVSVGIALKTLLKHGVKPDFVAIIEIGDCRFNLLGEDLAGIKFIFPPEVNSLIYTTGVEKAFNYYTENLFTSDWVQGYTGIDCSKYINRGTVSITALWSANLMGCNPIILAGQDLAFSGGECYAGDTFYSVSYEVNKETGEIEFTPKPYDDNKKADFEKMYGPVTKEQYEKAIELVIEQRKKELTTVKGQDGTLLPTSAGYSLFVKHFMEIIPRMYGKKLYNTSVGGAQIDGYENISMEEVLSQYAKEKIDVDAIIEEATGSYTKPFGVEQKINFINNAISLLTKYAECCDKGLQNTKKFTQQYNRVRRVSDDIRNILNRSLGSYIDAVQHYFTKNRYILSLSYKEYSDVEESLKVLKTENSDQHILEAHKNLVKFFDLGKKNSLQSVKILKEQKEMILNESTVAKS